jgi:hypothetical protein
LLLLFAVWKNISPASGIEKWIVPNSYFYNIDYINTYITFSVIYVFPLVIVFFKKIKFSYTTLYISFALTIILSLFTVKPSMATLTFTDYKTVGFVHQAFVEFLGNESLWLKIILAFLLFVGCYINTELFKNIYQDIKAKSIDKKLVFILLWLLFLLIMPFSYQVWEKYLTMVLPFLTLGIYLFLLPVKGELNN